jgi:hypothetical protein
MQTVKSALIASASVGVLLLGVGMSPAAAVPIFFTWNPGATLPTPLTTSSSDSIVNATEVTVSDYSVINGSNVVDGISNVVSESAILDIVGANAPVPGLVGSGTGGAADYQLFYEITNAQSTLTPNGPNSFTGAFTSFNYTLFGVVGGGCTFGVGPTGPTATGCGTLETLATGSLAPGLNQANIDNSIPSANVNANIVVGANAGGFFVAPAVSNLDFQSGFTNSAGVLFYCSTPDTITVGTTTPPGDCSGTSFSASDPFVEIDGGGGDVNLAVPEPQTLAMFGFGLIGLGWFVRRRVKKA